MTPEQALAFVEANGIVLESARGAVPTLAAVVAGEEIRGSWWSHPRGQEIFQLTRALRRSPEILVCRLVDGKISYVHRRLWPAVARLADDLQPARVSAVEEVHTARGSHEVRETPFPDWVPGEVLEEARELSREDAVAQIGVGIIGTLE